MAEMAAPREDHRQAALVGGGDHLGILAPIRPAARPRWRRRRPRASRPSRNGKNASDATTLPLQRSRRRLHHRDLDRVDAAHLPGADRQRAVRAGEDDRVRLHVRAHPPREPQRRPLLRRRLPLGHDPDAVGIELGDRASRSAIGLGGATDRAPRRRDPRPGAACRRGTSASRGRRARRRQRREIGASPRAGSPSSPESPAPRWCNDGAITASMNVEVDRRRRLGVDRAVEPDDAAEGRERIGVARAHVGVRDGRAGRRAARVGVLDHRRRRLGELERRCAAAASRSSRLVYDSSLPWWTSQAPMPFRHRP